MGLKRRVGDDRMEEAERREGEARGWRKSWKKSNATASSATNGERTAGKWLNQGKSEEAYGGEAEGEDEQSISWRLDSKPIFNSRNSRACTRDRNIAMARELIHTVNNGIDFD